MTIDIQGNIKVNNYFSTPPNESKRLKGIPKGIPKGKAL